MSDLYKGLPIPKGYAPKEIPSPPVGTQREQDELRRKAMERAALFEAALKAQRQHLEDEMSLRDMLLKGATPEEARQLLSGIESMDAAALKTGKDKEIQRLAMEEIAREMRMKRLPQAPPMSRPGTQLRGVSH